MIMRKSRVVHGFLRPGYFAARIVALLVVPAVLMAVSGCEGEGPEEPMPGWAQDPPVLESLVELARSESELRTALSSYSSGRGAMLRSLEGLGEAAARETQLRWYGSWLQELEGLDFDALSREGQVDYIGLRNRIEFEMAMAEEGREVTGGGEGPIGAEGLRAHLAREMIPYTPQELIAIAENEFRWMDEAMLGASRRMGFGDDWRAAQEAVKDAWVPPGEKPGLIRDTQYESEAFLEARGEITMAPLMREIWRMGMRGPEGQLTNPFFTGGEQITISYPTYDMTHDFKLMSARGNNPHFNRATVHHELIPGHGYQGFMTSRFNPHRRLFSTPFWTEGWALYWEFRLWDQGFPRGPQDEIGMLTWRLHRAARIVFSMKYHLGQMTEEEAVDYLVERVGFERSNAEAEVRRSVQATPLYQAAYMLGGLQLYALQKELVESGRMSPRAFHDDILLGGPMPMELVRLRLTGEGLTPRYRTQWRFYGDPLGAPPPEAASLDASSLRAAAQGEPPRGSTAPDVPNLAEMMASAAEDSDLRVAVRRLELDRAVMGRRYDVPLSPVRIQRERALLEGWLQGLAELDPAGLNEAGRAEYEELREEIQAVLAELEGQEERVVAMAPLVPFARPIQILQERRRDRVDVDPFGAAQVVENARKDVLRLTATLADDGATGLPGITPGIAADALSHLDSLREVLDNWYRYYYGFDPLFTWWVQTPYREFNEALAAYQAVIRQTWPEAG
jgi:hypothetical protein